MTENAPSSGYRKQMLSVLGQLCWREITETSKGSAFGFIWLVLGPLLTMILYVIVFGILFGGSFNKGSGESSLHFALGVYIGLATVNMVNETIGRSLFLLPGKVNFVKRVVFPVTFLPVVSVSGIAFKWIVNIFLWYVLAAILSTISLHAFVYFLLLFIPVLLICIGLGWLLSSLVVYLRDLQQLVPVLTQVIFWSSGVFYSTTRVQEFPWIWNILRWNPILLTVENFRNILLWELPPDFLQAAYIWIFAILMISAGALCFKRLKKGFADLL